MSINLRYDTDPEALAWARERVLGLVEKMRRFERQASESGAADAQQWRRIANIVESELVGGRGCVIAAFDERMVTLAPHFAAAQHPGDPS